MYEVALTFDRSPYDVEEMVAPYQVVRRAIAQNTLQLRCARARRACWSWCRDWRAAGGCCGCRDRRREPRGHLRRADPRGQQPGAARETMSALVAIIEREGKIRATNVTFIFWDLFYPLGYLLVFGVGIERIARFHGPSASTTTRSSWPACSAMASFGIASNTSWSFFLDRDNGIFYEMLTYPMSRSQYLLGKVLFNVGIAIGQAAITIALAAGLLDVPVRLGWPLLAAAIVIGTAGWFFFYAIFALRIRRNDAFNTVTSIFYFVFLFASSMFYPLEPLPNVARGGVANPITWQVDAIRYLTVGLGDGRSNRARGRCVPAVHGRVVCGGCAGVEEPGMTG